MSAKIQPSSQEKSAPRSRFQPQKSVGMRVEERDEQILCDLFLHRLMSRGQIEKLHFSSTVRCNARLRLLFDHKFVLRHFPPAAPFGAQAIYSVGKAALPIVSRRLEMDLPEVTRYFRRTQTPTFIEHTLAVVDIWMAFRQAVEGQNGTSIEQWLAEMQCRHPWKIRAPDGRWQEEVFKPDSFVRLETPEGYHDFFIEADLGHTSSRQFTGKLLTHQRYLESGLFEQTYACPTFRTLVITTGQRRLKNLREITESNGSELFWFTTFDALFDAGALEPIWAVPSQNEPVALTAFSSSTV